jgi:hypothetical protein
VGPSSSAAARLQRAFATHCVEFLVSVVAKEVNNLRARKTALTRSATYVDRRSADSE